MGCPLTLNLSLTAAFGRNHVAGLSESRVLESETPATMAIVALPSGAASYEPMARRKTTPAWRPKLQSRPKGRLSEKD